MVQISAIHPIVGSAGHGSHMDPKLPCVHWLHVHLGVQVAHVSVVFILEMACPLHSDWEHRFSRPLHIIPDPGKSWLNLTHIVDWLKSPFPHSQPFSSLLAIKKEIKKKRCEYVFDTTIKQTEKEKRK